ncbi:hypothetical protein HD554DRAFT_2042952 [Boletus coccyginus]|nr:hypothetical protein HD554DRAFT_2042952 [Boletus coccyginus]
MVVRSEVKRKHIHHPQTRPPLQHKGIILCKSTKNDLGGKVLHGNGKLLDDPYNAADYVKIGLESSFQLCELYLIIIQDQVLSLLADLPLDTLQVIEQFTPNHFANLLTALAEECPRSHAKLTYLEEDNKLFVMQPSSVHEAFIVALTRSIGTFTSGIGHNHCNYNFGSSLNKLLFYIKTDGSSRRAIPDYQLVMENNSDHAPGLPLIPKWIRELTVDLAFIIRIEKSPKWVSPNSKDTHMQKLHSQLFHAYNDFILALPVGSLGPVVMEEFTWISITYIPFELYLHPPDGPLVINDNLQDDHFACETLYPTVDMENVDLLLSRASDCLRQSLISEMEASQEDVQAITQVRQVQTHHCKFFSQETEEWT